MKQQSTVITFIYKHYHHQLFSTCFHQLFYIEFAKYANKTARVHIYSFYFKKIFFIFCFILKQNHRKLFPPLVTWLLLPLSCVGASGGSSRPGIRKTTVRPPGSCEELRKRQDCRIISDLDVKTHVLFMRGVMLLPQVVRQVYIIFIKSKQCSWC